MDTEGLWATYHHINKLAELGTDERGNCWFQADFVQSRDGLHAGLCTQEFDRDTMCHTAMCFAGWYAVLSGARLRGDHVLIGRGQQQQSHEHIGGWFAREAGLDRQQAGDITHGSNSLAQIGAMLSRITGKDER